MSKRDWFKCALMATESDGERREADPLADWFIWSAAFDACCDEYGYGVHTAEDMEHFRAQLGQFCCERACLC